MKLVFEEESHHYLDGIFDDRARMSITLKLLGKPLIIYNIAKLISIYKQIESISLPSNIPDITRLVEKAFPSIPIEEFNDSPAIGDELVEDETKFNS